MIAIKSVIIGALALGGCVSAFAADFPTKAPAIPVEQAVGWTGFYVGANGSYSWQGFGFPDPAVGQMNSSGAMGGLTLGADYQMGRLVAGIIGDVDFGNVGVTVMNGNFMTEMAREKTFSTVRGRIGYLVSPSFLVYGTAGAAIATVDQGENCLAGAPSQAKGGSFCNPLWAGPYNLTETQTFIGGVFGAGAEWMFAPQWSTKFEYLYANMGSKNFNLGAAPSGTATTPRTISLTEQQQLRLGVNYHF